MTVVAPRVLLLAVLLTWGMTASPVRAASDADQDVLIDWGRSVLASAPDSIKHGSRLQVARYVMQRYCQALDAARAPVDDCAGTRVVQTIAHPFDMLVGGGRFTCGAHASNLDLILRGVGMSSQMIVTKTNQWTVNSPHIALAIRDDDGKWYVMDPWYAAVLNQEGGAGTSGPPDPVVMGGQGLYTGPSMNSLCGIPIAQWASFVEGRGYHGFATADNMPYHSTIGEYVKANSPPTHFTPLWPPRPKPGPAPLTGPTEKPPGVAAGTVPLPPPPAGVQGTYVGGLGMRLNGVLYGVTVMVDYGAHTIVAATQGIQPYFEVTGQQSVSNGSLGPGTAQFDFTLTNASVATPQHFEFTGSFRGAYDAQGKLSGSANGTLKTWGPDGTVKTSQIQAQPMQTVRWDKD